MTTPEHLELILWSVMIAAASVTTIASIVGTLTYLLTREHGHAAAAVPAAARGEAAARTRPAARTPMAVAG